MAKEHQAGTAAAHNPPDLAAQVAQLTNLVGSLTDSIKTMAAGQQQLADQLKQTQTAETAPGAPANAAPAAKPLTAEDVAKVVHDSLNARQASQAKRDARNNFAISKMKDVPAAYHRDLPETDNPAELEAAEQRIRTQYQSDLKAAGVKAAPVGSQAGNAGQPPSSTGRPDVSKWSNSQKIESLIASSKPSLSQGQGEAEAQAQAQASVQGDAI